MQSKLIRPARHVSRKWLASLTLCAISAPSFPAFAQSALPTDVIPPPTGGQVESPTAPASSAARSTAPLPAKPAPAAVPTAVDDGAALRTAGYVAGGVGLVGLALFAIAGLGAKSTYDELQSSCGSTPCSDAAHQSDIEKGRMLQTLANIGLATGLTGIGVSATLLVIASNSSAEKRMPTTSLSPNGVMVTYGGHF